METLPVKFEDICRKNLTDIKEKSKYSIFKDCKNVIKDDKKHYESIKNKLVGKKCSDYILKQLNEKKEVTKKDLYDNCEAFKKIKEEKEKKKKGGRRGKGGATKAPALPKPEEKKKEEKKDDPVKEIIKDVTTALNSADPVSGIVNAIAKGAEKICIKDLTETYNKGELTKAYNELFSILTNPNNPVSVIGWNFSGQWLLNSKIFSLLGKIIKCSLVILGAKKTLNFFRPAPTPTRSGPRPRTPPRFDDDGDDEDDDDDDDDDDKPDKNVKTDKKDDLSSQGQAQPQQPTMAQLYTQMLAKQAKEKSDTMSSSQFEALAKEMKEAAAKEAAEKKTTSTTTNPTTQEPPLQDITTNINIGRTRPKKSKEKEASLYSDLGGGLALGAGLFGLSKLKDYMQQMPVARDMGTAPAGVAPPGGGEGGAEAEPPPAEAAPDPQEDEPPKKDSPPKDPPTLRPTSTLPGMFGSALAAAALYGMNPKKKSAAPLALSAAFLAPRTPEAESLYKPEEGEVDEDLAVAAAVERSMLGAREEEAGKKPAPQKKPIETAAAASLQFEDQKDIDKAALELERAKEAQRQTEEEITEEERAEGVGELGGIAAPPRFEIESLSEEEEEEVYSDPELTPQVGVEEEVAPVPEFIEGAMAGEALVDPSEAIKGEDLPNDPLDWENDRTITAANWRNVLESHNNEAKGAKLQSILNEHEHFGLSKEEMKEVLDDFTSQWGLTMRGSLSSTGVSERGTKGRDLLERIRLKATQKPASQYYKSATGKKKATPKKKKSGDI